MVTLGVVLLVLGVILVALEVMMELLETQNQLTKLQLVCVTSFHLIFITRWLRSSTISRIPCVSQTASRVALYHL